MTYLAIFGYLFEGNEQDLSEAFGEQRKTSKFNLQQHIVHSLALVLFVNLNQASIAT